MYCERVFNNNNESYFNFHERMHPRYIKRKCVETVIKVKEIVLTNPLFI